MNNKRATYSSQVRKKLEKYSVKHTVKLMFIEVLFKLNTMTLGLQSVR